MERRSDKPGMILTDKGTRFKVTPTDKSVEVASDPRTDIATFMAWWKQQAEGYGLRFHPTGQDYGIAGRLLKNHGLDRVTAVAVMFWRAHSDPLIEGEYGQHMVLFASKYDQAERDYNSSE